MNFLDAAIIRSLSDNVTKATVNRESLKLQSYNATIIYIKSIYRLYIDYIYI